MGKVPANAGKAGKRVVDQKVEEGPVVSNRYSAMKSGIVRSGLSVVGTAVGWTMTQAPAGPVRSGAGQRRDHRR